MKEFTLEEVQACRALFVDRGYEERIVTVSGYEIPHFVLPNTLEPRLADFEVRCTGRGVRERVFGISESVPEAFRGIWLWHELIEFTAFDPSDTERCYKTLLWELNSVPPRLNPEYLERRAAYFKSLAAYCESQPRELYSVHDVSAMRRNASYLDGLLREWHASHP